MERLLAAECQIILKSRAAEYSELSPSVHVTDIDFTARFFSIQRGIVNLNSQKILRKNTF